MRIKTEDKQALLEEDDVEQRMRKLIGILTRELEVLELGSKIQSDVRGEIDKSQREYFLRQQLKAIQQELGETDEQEAEINELRQKIDELALPEEADKAARRELDRLANISPQSAEYPVIRTYLDWIITLPWNVHERRQPRRGARPRDPRPRPLRPREGQGPHPRVPGGAQAQGDLHGPILCFVGPPGVGKTSLGHSIAEAMGRKFERISVGGVRDEAEIRGHRRTYVGAMPGIIVRAMRDAGTNNPLFMIDEIDKMGADWRGDPSSAMLEVLDPEQNITLPRPLPGPAVRPQSKVLFITTANQLEPIPGPLRDRMEIINLAGYTIEEKLHIAQQVPRAAAGRGQRPASRVRSRFERRRPPRDHRQLHARGRRAQPRARDRHRSAASSPARWPRRATAAASASRSTSSACTSCSAGRASSPRSSGAPATPAWPPASPGRRSAATSSSSRRRPCPATATSRSPASSATS